MKKVIGTLYRRVNGGEASLLSLAEWLEQVRSGRWRAEVERYRSLKAEGRDEEAVRVKQGLPAFMVAGNTLTARKPEFLEDRTGVCMLDADHVSDDPGMLETLKERAMNGCPWLCAVHVTTSGTGLRFFARIGLVPLYQYREAYVALMEALQQVLGCPLDGQCKDVCRTSYASYDPRLLMRASMDEVREFPFRLPGEPEAADESSPVEQAFLQGFADEKKAAASVSGSGSGAGAASPSCSGHSPAEDPGSGQGWLAGAASACGSASATTETENRAEEPALTPREVDRFFARFLTYNPFIPGERNNFFIRMGQRARFCRFSEGDLRLLFRLCVERLGGGEVTARFIDSRLRWGYTHSDVRKDDAPVSQSQFSQYGCGAPEKVEEPLDAEDDEEEIIGRTCPLVSDEVYEALPALLADGLVAARTRQLKDVLLLATLCNVSACLPNVSMLYSGKRFYPHLYVMVVAGAGSGKGVMAYAARLPEEIQKQWDAEFSRATKKYRRDLNRWNQEQQRAMREKREPDWEMDPGSEPVHKLILLSPTMSKSQMMRSMEAIQPHGPVMNATEIDEMSNAVGSDYGRHSPELRKIAMHETVGQNFKVDGRPIRIDVPKMALCMSGTPNQVSAFIPSSEDGMLSRFLVLLYSASPQWFSAAPDDSLADVADVYKGLAVQVKALFDFLEKWPTEVRLKPAHWKEHTRYFRRVMRTVQMEGNEAAHSIVVRHGIQVARIAMILSAIRKFEAGMTMKDFVCSDGDFRIAMELVKVLMQHSLQLLTTLPDVNSNRKRMKIFFTCRQALDNLPETFYAHEFVAEMGRRGISRATSYRRLRKMVKQGLLEPLPDGKYKKIG